MSGVGQMKIKAREPDFSIATMRLGNEIHAQLVGASRKSRKRWMDIFKDYREVIPELRRMIASSQHTANLPLVRAFMHEWARNLDWDLCESGCWDAIGVQVPHGLVAELAVLGGVENFYFMLGDLANACCATLGNNDHNLEFGLIFNCPIWIELASHDEYVSSFEKQIGMIIHHEMAHFRHQRKDLRSELHAHTRGIAWVLSSADLPNTKKAAIEVMQREHSDIWQNEEIRYLFTDVGESGWRLLKLWIHYFKKYGAQQRGSANAK